MGQTKGVLTQQIKDNAAYGVGRVNAADETVAASVGKIEAKVDSDRNDNHNAKRGLKDLYREMERINKGAIKLAKKEEKSAEKQMTEEQATLQDHLKDAKIEARDYYSELKGLRTDIKGHTPGPPERRQDRGAGLLLRAEGPAHRHQRRHQDGPEGAGEREQRKQSLRGVGYARQVGGVCRRDQAEYEGCVRHSHR